MRALVPLVLCLAVAVGYGLLREPTYTASARVFINKPDVRVPAIPGQVEAGKTLAARYSEVLQTNLAPDVARAAGLTADQVRDRLVAEPIPGRPMFEVRATGPDVRAAVGLAVAATDRIAATISARNQTDRTSRALLERYRAAVATETALRLRIDAVNRRLARGGPDDELEARLFRLRADAQTSSLQIVTLSRLYSEARAEASTSRVVEIIDRPTTAASDFVGTLVRAVLLALVIGGLLAALRLGLHRRLLSPRRGSAIPVHDPWAPGALVPPVR